MCDTETRYDEEPISDGIPSLGCMVVISFMVLMGLAALAVLL